MTKYSIYLVKIWTVDREQYSLTWAWGPWLLLFKFEAHGSFYTKAYHAAKKKSLGTAPPIPFE